MTDVPRRVLSVLVRAGVNHRVVVCFTVCAVVTSDLYNNIAELGLVLSSLAYIVLFVLTIGAVVFCLLPPGLMAEMLMLVVGPLFPVFFAFRANLRFVVVTRESNSTLSYELIFVIGAALLVDHQMWRLIYKDVQVGNRPKPIVHVLRQANYVTILSPFIVSLVFSPSLAIVPYLPFFPGLVVPFVVVVFTAMATRVHSFLAAVIANSTSAWSQWTNLKQPSELRMFFLAQFVCNLLRFLWMKWDDRETTFLSFWKTILASSTETTMALIALSSCLVYVGDRVIDVVKIFIKDKEEVNLNDRGVYFFLLCIQTGLVNLPTENRVERLWINTLILATTFLGSVHGLLRRKMETLQASSIVRTGEYARVFAVYLPTVVVPLFVVIRLWTAFSVSPWILAITAFVSETVLSVVLTLLLFSLSQMKRLTAERLDDWTFKIRLTEKLCAVLFAIFHTFNNAWAALFGIGVNLVFLFTTSMHVLIIWAVVHSSWKDMKTRLQLVEMVSALRDATPIQLLRLKDPCAICYEDFTDQAKLTNCNHFYHKFCLRKWLYIKDKCPLCQRSVFEWVYENEEAAGFENIHEHVFVGDNN